MQVIEKRAAPGPHGAGRYRSGSGCRMAYRVDGRPSGSPARCSACARRCPSAVSPAGSPARPTEFRIRARRWHLEMLAAHAADVSLGPGEAFEFCAGSGGGWGDPLDREPALVRLDVAHRAAHARRQPSTPTAWCSTTPAPSTPRAPSAARRDPRRERLAARGRPRPPSDVGDARTAAPRRLPLYHGVVQRGRVAVAAESGAVLAVAPAHWTDGCPVLETERRSSVGAPWILRTYLDPARAAPSTPKRSPRASAARSPPRPATGPTAP